MTRSYFTKLSHVLMVFFYASIFVLYHMYPSCTPRDPEIGSGWIGSGSGVIGGRSGVGRGTRNHQRKPKWSPLRPRRAFGCATPVSKKSQLLRFATYRRTLHSSRPSLFRAGMLSTTTRESLVSVGTPAEAITGSRFSQKFDLATAPRPVAGWCCAVDARWCRSLCRV